MGQNSVNLVIDFRADITQRTGRFTVGERAFKTIYTWLANSSESLRFLLIGIAGSGKSAIAVHLAQFSLGTPQPAGCDLLTASILSAWHFCSARNLLWISPHIFAGTPTNQFAAHYPPFQQASLQKRDEDSTSTFASIQSVERPLVGLMANNEIKNFNVRDIPALEAFNRIVGKLWEALSHDNSQTASLLQCTPGILALARGYCWARPRRAHVAYSAYHGLPGYAIHIRKNYLDWYRTDNLAWLIRGQGLRTDVKRALLSH